MNDWITVTGAVIASSPMGEYDRRVLLLTAEHGKISAFARGSRRMGSALLSTTRLFAFGRFELYAGKNSYSVKSADIQEYFSFLETDPEALCYASYFAELADYYAREEAEDYPLVQLLYMAIRSLQNEKLSRPLIRYTYELKLLAIEGEAQPEAPDHASESAARAWEFVLSRPVSSCFQFTISGDGFRSFSAAVAALRNTQIDRRFRSLAVLEDFITMREIAAKGIGREENTGQDESSSS